MDQKNKQKKDADSNNTATTHTSNIKNWNEIFGIDYIENN